MIARTISLIRTEWTTFTTFIVFLAALGVAQDRGLMEYSATPSTIVDFMIGFMAQRAILFNIRMGYKGDGNSIRNVPSFKYFLKALAILAIGIVPGILILAAAAAGDLVEFGSEDGGLLIIVASTLVIFPIALTLFGTWLPAEIYGRKKGFYEAAGRGKKRFFKVFSKYFSVIIIQLIFVSLVLVAADKVAEFHLPPNGAGLALDIGVNLVSASIKVVLGCMNFVLAALLYKEHLGIEAAEEGLAEVTESQLQADPGMPA